MDGVIIVNIFAYADLPDEVKAHHVQRVCHECPEGPCPQECLQTEVPIECKRGKVSSRNE
jgi:hypothetical protein